MQQPAAAPPKGIDRLTPKELACLRLVAQRLSSHEIASELGIAKSSVDTYCDRARAKLGVSGRRQAARLVASASSSLGPAPALTMGAEAGTQIGASEVAPKVGVTMLVGAAIPLALVALFAGLHALAEMSPVGR